MTGFRLLAIQSESSPESSGKYADGRSAGRVGFALAPSGNDQVDLDTWVSVITGRNGLGKSRALGAAAALFAGTTPEGVSSRNRMKDAWRVTFQCGSDICQLSGGPGKKISGKVNGEPQSIGTMPLPSKVIALSTTVVDKFPLPRWESANSDTPRNATYNYMGLRDRTGRASATSVIYRALEALVEATVATQERRSRIAEVFDFLGYLPRVEHSYRWRYGSLLREPKNLASLLEPRSTIATPSRLQALVSREPTILLELQAAVTRSAAETSAKREFRLVADFRQAGSGQLDRFRDIQLLKRAGLIYLDSIEVKNSRNDRAIDLREVSSGELSLATTFLGLAAVIEDNALVMIDEPEVSLHPEWQEQYLDLLTEVFSMYQGCHFVVATHSPLVVSGIPTHHANVVSLDSANGTFAPGIDYSGDSIDEVLVRAFEVVGKNNLFVKQRLVEALRLAADGEISSARFSESLAPLVAVAGGLADDNPAKNLIEQLISARQVRSP